MPASSSTSRSARSVALLNTSKVTGAYCGLATAAILGLRRSVYAGLAARRVTHVNIPGFGDACRMYSVRAVRRRGHWAPLG